MRELGGRFTESEDLLLARAQTNLISAATKLGWSVSELDSEYSCDVLDKKGRIVDSFSKADLILGRAL